MSENRFKRVFFTDSFLNMNTAKKIAYVGIFTALAILVNSVLSFDVSSSQKITLNYFFSFFCGTIFGPVVGFAICFIGDLLAFLIPIFSSGVYWFLTGLCSGLLAFIPGIIFTTLRFKFRGAVYVKAAISIALMYILITCGLGALSNYLYVKLVIFAGREYTKTFIVYLGSKIAFSTIVSAINYVLVFLFIPLFNSIKSIGFKIE